MARNKNRVYLALYERTGHSNYHSAILVSPKNPRPEDSSVWRLHVMNRPDPTRHGNPDRWSYEPRTVYGRTNHLAALVLLGKTQKSGQVIAEILSSVPVVQDDPSWRCRDWIFAAIQHLATQDIIPSLSLSAESIYANGVRVADALVQVPQAERMSNKIPTCSLEGHEIPSEV